MALLLRFDGKIMTHYKEIYYNTFLVLTFIKIIVYIMMGLYSSLWRYASIDELLQIFFATAIETALCYLYGEYFNVRLPRSVYIISWFITFIFIGGSRLSYRILRRLNNLVRFDKSEKSRVMVIGAGEAGSMVIKELKKHDELNSVPVAIIDDDTHKHRSFIHGVPVIGGRNKIKAAVSKHNIDQIIIALPSAPKSEVRKIIDICKDTKCKLKILPGVYEILDEKVSLKRIRDVNIEDLLGRDEVKLNNEEIAGYLKDEVILVTGGGGSIGSELCRQIAKYEPKKIIVYDIYENNAYDLEVELKSKYKNRIDIDVVIGSIRDIERLRQVFAEYKPGVVFHAAAHKHVPLMEFNPGEAVKNNVFGTLNVAQCADEFGTKRFVLISTDKAVNPTNIMGATKRLAEMIIQAMDKRSKTEFVAVRFGNVLGSNGSVIPLFKKQIAQGGPVTVTHPEVTRYFMTIPEAAQLVIQAGAMAKGGEIFILDMGQPVKILDLARDLIKLSGFEPDEDIKIVFTGLRPGEKLYEELLLAEEGIQGTHHENIYIGKPLALSFNELMLGIRALQNFINDKEELKRCLKNIVSTYKELDEAAASIGLEGKLKNQISN
ncbi:MAG TPA: polysaccharide biosynthesis protein [Clostridiales bacterium]|nr:polysaccharide biosynthesis protein [Clostridiales bacterium]